MTMTNLQHPPTERTYTQFDVEAMAARYRLPAWDHFGYFRTLIRPTMLTSWWTREIAWALEEFYDDLIAGKRPRLAIGSPPQHGKSLAAEDFIAWVAGKNPDLKTIYASYSDELGTRTNLDLQRTFKLQQVQGYVSRDTH
jgi:hypothetical protein